MEETDSWKKSEVLIPERETTPDELSSTDMLLAPATGDSSGGLDGIGENLNEVVKDTKPKVDIATAINLVEIKGREEHIKQYMLISRSHFEENAMGAVEAPCGLPIGMVYTLIAEAQKYYPDLDLTMDKIIIHVKLKNNCKKCSGRGHIGRVFDKDTHKITDNLFKCTCLKTTIEVEKGQPQEDGDVDSNSESQ